MLKMGFFAVVISFGWYLFDEVYVKQQTASHNTHKEEFTAVPDLTAERIELLRRIADDVGKTSNPATSSFNTDAGDTDAEPSGTELLDNVQSQLISYPPNVSANVSTGVYSKVSSKVSGRQLGDRWWGS